VSNPSKRKGSLFELQVARYLDELFPAEKTVAGATVDRGDIWTPTVDAAWQVKNRQTLSLGVWLTETLAQQAAARRSLHWLIVKRKNTTANPVQFAVCTLEQARQISHDHYQFQGSPKP